MKSVHLGVWCVAIAATFTAGWFIGVSKSPVESDSHPPETSTQMVDILPVAEAPRSGPRDLDLALASRNPIEFLSGTTRSILQMNADELEAEIGRAAGMPRTRLMIETLGYLWQRFGEIDGPRALAAAKSFSPASQRNIMIGHALQGIARVNPHAAWEIALSDESLSGLISFAYVMLDEGRPDLVVAKLLELPEGNLKSRLTSHLSQQLSRYEPEVLLPLISDLPAGATRTRFVTSFVGEWSQSDPQAAADWALNLEGQELAQAMGTVTSIWSRQSPEAVSSWLLAQAPLPKLDPVLGQVAIGLASREDVNFAVQLINGIADPVIRRQTTESTVGLISRVNPRAAAGLAETEQDSVSRGRLLEAVFTRWRNSDLPAAQQYLATSPSLSPEERSALQEILSTPAAGAEGR